jgi:hypothetical protein
MDSILPYMTVLLNDESSNVYDSWYSILLNCCQIKEDSMRRQQVGGVFNKIGSTFYWVQEWTQTMTCAIPTNKSP